LTQPLLPEEEGRPTRRRKATAPAGITTMRAALDYADPRPSGNATAGKGPYATRLSGALAVLVANGLRPAFPGILPDEHGRGQESRARTAKGFKKLDVNYSTVELGLALGVSIKTLNFRDPSTGRYTKNYSRIDNELRAEAIDYHQRQPYAMLAGLLFLPADACDDGARGARGEEPGVSSFGAAIKFFRNRTPRRDVKNALDLFERFFVGIYEHQEAERGHVVFYDVMRPRPPRNRRPYSDEVLTLKQVLDEIRVSYDERNNPPFEWAP